MVLRSLVSNKVTSKLLAMIFVCVVFLLGGRPCARMLIMAWQCRRNCTRVIVTLFCFVVIMATDPDRILISLVLHDNALCSGNGMERQKSSRSTHLQVRCLFYNQSFVDQFCFYFQCVLDQENSNHRCLCIAWVAHRLGVVSVDVNSTGTVAVSSSLDSQIKIWCACSVCVFLVWESFERASRRVISLVQALIRTPQSVPGCVWVTGCNMLDHLDTPMVLYLYRTL